MAVVLSCRLLAVEKSHPLCMPATDVVTWGNVRDLAAMFVAAPRNRSDFNEPASLLAPIFSYVGIRIWPTRYPPCARCVHDVTGLKYWIYKTAATVTFVKMCR